jgi:cytochrome c biogenesis protein
MDYASEVVVAGPGDPVSGTIRVNEPLRTHGVTVYQSTYGTSAVIRVLDRQGDVVVDGAVPLLWQSPDGRIAYGEVRVPERGLLVYVATPASGKTVPTIRSGQIQVDLVDLATGTVLASTLADPGRPAVAGDHIVLFARERPFTGLVVARDPGAPFVWVAAALLIVGIVTTLFFRYRRVWVRVTAHGTGSLVHVVVPDRRDPAADALSARIASAISAGPSVGGTS